MSSDPIQEETLKCFWAHYHPEWGDRLPIDMFNRLLAKSIRPSGWTPNTHSNVRPQEILSRRERWTTEALERIRPSHTFTAGEDFDCPIVLVEYEGNSRLLDGGHRINRWIAMADTRLHDVNIHSIGVVVEFVELPAVASGGALPGTR